MKPEKIVQIYSGGIYAETNVRLDNLLSKKIPAVLGILLLLGGLAVAIYMVGQSQGLLSRAGPTSTPSQVKTTSVEEDSLVVSWITDTRVTGTVRYGESANNLDKVLGDDRDQLTGTADLYTTHYVTLRGLKPSTKYYFKIGSGSQTYGRTGTEDPYEITTGPVIANKPALDVINGKVVLNSGQPAPGVIVYVDVPGGAPLSAQTKTTGAWSLTLSSVRTPDLSRYQSYDANTTVLSITVQGADLGTATATVTTNNDTPVSDITLGRTLDLTSGTSVSQPKTIEIQNNALSTKRLEVAPKDTIIVINKDGVPHSVTAKTGEFDTGLISGGGNATFSAPIAVRDYEFSDTANPTVEALMGVLVVKQTQAAGTGGAGYQSLGDTSALEATLSVKLLNPATNGEQIATSSPEIRVKAPAGTKVKLILNSTPQTTEITVDADGLVNWTPPAGLEPGLHTLTVEYTDEAGILQRFVRTFTVLAAEPSGTGGLPAFTATPSATITPTPTASPTGIPRESMPSTEAGVPEPGVLTLTLAILTMGVGLFIGGLIWQVRILKLRI